MFRNDLIHIEQMLQTIERIFEYTHHFTDPEEFSDDYKTFDATLMNFIALGETVGKLSEKFRDRHDQIEWRKIYAFRNIIAHDYFGIDQEEVLGIIRKHLPKLKNDLENLVKTDPKYDR
jgi:uncharacterized protein with HEPN domain